MTQKEVPITYRCCNKLQVWSEGMQIHFRHVDVVDHLDIDHVDAVSAPEVTQYICDAWVWEAHRIYENKNGANIKSS